MGISSALGSSALLPAGLGFRNVLINGDFKVWQRGTSKATGSSSGTGYLADRWNGARSAYTAGGTLSRQTASLDGFQYCSRIQRDSGNTSAATFYYYQTLETVTSIPLANKPVVYSFYIRAGANFSGSVTARLYSGTATDQSNYPDTAITGQATVISSALTITTTWQRVILYGSVASSATQLFVGFDWTPSGTAGAADYFEITGVQLESNVQPTPFEQRPIGVELQLCQRYYYRCSQIGAFNYIERSSSGVNFSNSIGIPFQHLVEMRSAPIYGLVSGTLGLDNYGAATSVTYSSQNTTTKSARINFTTSGLTDYRPYFLIGNSAATVEFNSEL